MKTNRNLKPTNIRVCGKAKDRLIDLAEKHGVTTSDLVRTAIAEKLPVWETQGIKLAPSH